MQKEFVLGFGNRELKVALPAERVVQVVEGKQVAPVADVAAAVKEALNKPIGTPALKQVVAKGDKVAIIVSDVTRSWIRYDLFLPTLLDELNVAGVPDSDIYLVVGLGAHRYHTDAENVAVYGQQVTKRVAIYQSHAQKSEDFAYVGTTTRGVKTYINKQVIAADKVILTGGIVYHLMGGFGGGRKSIMPGVSGYDTIQSNHSFCLHDVVGQGISPHCVSGKLQGNNMHEDMTEMAAMVNPAFLLNAVLTRRGKSPASWPGIGTTPGGKAAGR
jgi:nickel-dependent lactate racemase